MGNAPQRLGLLPSAQNHILGQQYGKERFMAIVTQLSAAFALAVMRSPSTMAGGQRQRGEGVGG